jgi:hypothetical protein
MIAPGDLLVILAIRRALKPSLSSQAERMALAVMARFFS